MYEIYDFIFNNGLENFIGCLIALALVVLLPILITIAKYDDNADDNIGKILIG
jgi:uncharacterized membrane protein YccC